MFFAAVVTGAMADMEGIPVALMERWRWGFREIVYRAPAALRNWWAGKIRLAGAGKRCAAWRPIS